MSRPLSIGVAPIIRTFGFLTGPTEYTLPLLTQVTGLKIKMYICDPPYQGVQWKVGLQEITTTWVMTGGAKEFAMSLWRILLFKGIAGCDGEVKGTCLHSPLRVLCRCFSKLRLPPK